MRFEDVITDLEISRKAVELEKERAAEYRQEAQKLKADFEAQKERLAAQREKMLADAKEEARKVLTQAKADADYMLKEMTKAKTGGDKQSAEAARKLLKESLENTGINLLDAESDKRTAPENLQIGEGVFIHSLSQKGVVTSAPDSSGDVMVKAGIMKVKANIKNLSRIDVADTVTKAKKDAATKARTIKAQHIRSEVDLRGMLAAEAIEHCDKYLDEAYLSGLKQVSIIHGKGTGALRSAITKHLKGHPYVVSHRLGTFGEGEHGVTICELK